MSFGKSGAIWRWSVRRHIGRRQQVITNKHHGHARIRTLRELCSPVRDWELWNRSPGLFSSIRSLLSFFPSIFGFFKYSNCLLFIFYFIPSSLIIMNPFHPFSLEVFLLIIILSVVIWTSSSDGVSHLFFTGAWLFKVFICLHTLCFYFSYYGVPCHEYS